MTPPVGSSPARSGSHVRMAEREEPGTRANRELIEMLNELRVAFPGVQVLFAFLLTVPFTQRFEDLDATERRVYYAAVLTTVIGAILLIAPTAHHRLRFRDGVKEQMLGTTNVLAIVGLAFVALSMGAVLYLITSVLYESHHAATVAGVFAVVLAVVWFVLPWFYKPTDRTPAGPAESEG